MAENNKTPITKKWYFWVAIVAVVLVIGAIVSGSKGSDDNGSDNGDSGSSQVSQNTQKEYGIGDTIASDGMEVSVVSVERNYTPEGAYAAKPKEGKEFVKVNLTISNTSSESKAYNTFYWKIEDSDGDINDYSDAMMAQADDSLGSGDLAAGGKKKASIVFSVPAGDEGLKLHYNANYFSDKNEVVIKL